MNAPDDAEIEVPSETPTPPSRPAKTATKDSAKAEALRMAEQRSEPQPDEPEQVDENAAEIVKLVQHEPGKVLLSDQHKQELIEHIRMEIEAFEPDLSTDKGRKAVASLAYKITRTKTAIDKAGKDLNAELRDKINAVDERRRNFREQLDELADEARKPLTIWEEQEEVRASNRQNFSDKLEHLGSAWANDTSAAIEERLTHLNDLYPDINDFGDEHQEAIDLRARVIEELSGHLERTREAEKVAADLAEERRKAAEREAEIEQLRQREAEREREEVKRQEQESAEVEAKALAEEQGRRQREEAAAAEERRRECGRNALRAIKAIEARYQDLLELNDYRSDLPTLEAMKAELTGAQYTEDFHGERAGELKDSHTRLMAAIDTRMNVLRQQQREEADEEEKTRRKVEARDALVSLLEINEPTATRIVKAIADGQIPHITMRTDA